MAINNTNMAVNGVGLLAIAADGTRLQMPTWFQMEDATGTTKKSPLAVADTEIDLIVPMNAVAIVVNPVGADLRISIVDAGTAAAPSLVVKDGETQRLPVAKWAGNGATSIFLLRDAAVSLTLHFHFEMIGT